MMPDTSLPSHPLPSPAPPAEKGYASEAIHGYIQDVIPRGGVIQAASPPPQPLLTLLPKCSCQSKPLLKLPLSPTPDNCSDYLSFLLVVATRSFTTFKKGVRSSKG